MLWVNRRATRYALAILAVFVALYLRYLLTPLLGEQQPYFAVLLAVVFSAWLCGLGPSIVTTVFGALGVWYLILPPSHSWAIPDRSELFGLLRFLVLSGVLIALAESNRHVSVAESKLAAIVSSSDDAIISKDLDGIITSWNDGAQRLYGWTAAEVVGRPVTVIVPPELAHEETEILSCLKAGQRIDPYETIRVSKTRERVEVSLTVSPIRDSAGRIVGASKVARDISERKQAEAKLKAANDELEQRVKERTVELQNKTNELVNQTAVVQELSARLLELQDEERRRIARELHDSVGQLLALIGMNNSSAAKEKELLSSAAQKCVEQNVSLIEEVSQEIRTISHLLHPPLLEEMGLGSALRWYIDGFAERSKIDVRLDMPADFERLTNDLEICIFRIVQECLTNIHRHSGSAKATIRLAREYGCVHLEVRDEGKGIPPEKQAALNSSGALGVGLRGMRERLRQVGGTLQVHSNGTGTVVTATLPYPAVSTQAAGGVTSGSAG